MLLGRNVHCVGIYHDNSTQNDKYEQLKVLHKTIFYFDENILGGVNTNKFVEPHILAYSDKKLYAYKVENIVALKSGTNSVEIQCLNDTHKLTNIPFVNWADFNFAVVCYCNSRVPLDDVPDLDVNSLDKSVLPTIISLDLQSLYYKGINVIRASKIIQNLALMSDVRINELRFALASDTDHLLLYDKRNGKYYMIAASTDKHRDINEQSSDLKLDILFNITNISVCDKYDADAVFNTNSSGFTDDFISIYSSGEWYIKFYYDSSKITVFDHDRLRDILSSLNIFVPMLDCDKVFSRSRRSLDSKSDIITLLELLLSNYPQNA